MPATMQGGVPSGAARLRVVLLARHAHAVPDRSPWPVLDAVETVVWCGQQGGTPWSSPWWDRTELVVAHPDARRVGSADRAGRPRTARATLRSTGARAKSVVTARRRGVDPGWLWALKSERLLASDLKSSALLVALDADTAGALRAVPELARQVPFLEPGEARAVWDTLRCWQSVLEELDQLLIAAQRDTTAVVTELSRVVEHVSRVPDLLLGELPARTEALARALVATLPLSDSSALVESVLRPLVEGAAPAHRGTVAVASAAAALARGNRVPDEAELDAVVRAGFGAADEALDAGDTDLAIARAHEALSLLLHRSRHSALVGSPIADDAAAFLAPFTTSRVSGLFRGAGPVGGPDRAMGPPAGGQGASRRPRVLILPGAYGAFHQDLVESLESVADVVAPDLPQHLRMLRRRRPSAADLEVLTGLRQGRINIAKGVWRDDPERTTRLRVELRALRTLWGHLVGADVVVSDWIDAGALWASQVRPPGVRLVLRAHSLDLLDPWVHLVDWRAVDEVLVSNEGMASIYRELTAGTRAPSGITARPHRPDLADWHRPRDEVTRFTIGMVGWGRVVKDPAWALELLERDERRHLVLIGAAPGAEPYAATRRYMEDLLARMDQPHLRDRITVVGPTTDVAGELEQVGIILSSSVREGWHLGLIEGVASGAVPVVRDWPLVASRGGARSLFPEDWIVADIDAADARITALADPVAWRSAAQRARAEALELFAADPAARTIRDAVLGGRGE